MSNLEKPRPEGWHESALGPYFEALWSNAVATFAHKPESRRNQEVDGLFTRFLNTASAVKGKGMYAVAIPLFLFLRAHSAYKAALALGMGGATTEAMAVLRLALEFAGYASIISQDHALAETWLRRGDSAESREKTRKAFTAAAARRAVEKESSVVAKAYEALYDRLIDFGAHPNEFTVTTNLQMHETEEGATIKQIYLQNDSLVLDHCLRTSAQVGITVLHIFETIFRERFTELGLNADLQRVSRGL